MTGLRFTHFKLEIFYEYRSFFMEDFKVVINNGSNDAASMVKNVPEREGEERFDLLK